MEQAIQRVYCCEQIPWGHFRSNLISFGTIGQATPLQTIRSMRLIASHQGAIHTDLIQEGDRYIAGCETTESTKKNDPTGLAMHLWYGLFSIFHTTLYRIWVHLYLEYETVWILYISFIRSHVPYNSGTIWKRWQTNTKSAGEKTD